MAKARVRFALCIDNSDYPASLEQHKVYRVLPDRDVESDGDLRVIDESGEDYIYEGDRFLLLELPDKTARQMRRSFARHAEHQLAADAHKDARR